MLELEPVWSLQKKEKSVALPGIESRPFILKAVAVRT
jgi:hypothetical protein